MREEGLACDGGDSEGGGGRCEGGRGGCDGGGSDGDERSRKSQLINVTLMSIVKKSV